ncbi:MAG: hydroxyethylthiazole kinase [Firmicutes bacterium]|nr:hydroxyethylthiazole kinase [Bacillota bacterium]
MDDTLRENGAAIREQIIEQNPLIHHITNLVVTHSTANATLAWGASPVMADAPEEVAEMTSAAQALVLNIGTLTSSTLAAMRLAAAAATTAHIPIVLDPVGAGATVFRTQAAQRLAYEAHPQVIRGNAGEIAALCDREHQTRGVDTVGEVSLSNRIDLAQEAARRLHTVVALTGATDVITDADRILLVENGHPLLTRLTGTGCMATTAVACFLATGAEPLLAAAAALGAYGLAAEQAAATATGPGSFAIALLDRIAALDTPALRAGLRIRDASSEEGESI